MVLVPLSTACCSHIVRFPGILQHEIFSAQKIGQIRTDAQKARSSPEVPKRQTGLTKVPKSQAVLTEGSKSKTGFTKVPNRQPTNTQSTTNYKKGAQTSQK